jgi:hypothetical protein
MGSSAIGCAVKDLVRGQQFAAAAAAMVTSTVDPHSYRWE